jgi:hypothetical protein
MIGEYQSDGTPGFPVGQNALFVSEIRQGDFFKGKSI